MLALQPVLARAEGRLHFAGEHTSVTSPGMESAVESAERVADEVFARMSA
jgi:monoamine oxidase